MKLKHINRFLIRNKKSISQAMFYLLTLMVMGLTLFFVFR